MWYLVHEGDKYGFLNNLLRKWFEDWITNNQLIPSQYPQLMYPSWIFDHAKGFARVTKALAYGEPGHIHEDNPTPLQDIHLPYRILGAHCSSVNANCSSMLTQKFSRLPQRRQKPSTHHPPQMALQSEQSSSVFKLQLKGKAFLRMGIGAVENWSVAA